MPQPLKVVFFGANARMYLEGFALEAGLPLEIREIDDEDRSPEAKAAFADADVVIGIHWRDASVPLTKLRLYQVAATGLDGLDMSLVPPSAAIANCFGHEVSIAEYVILVALLHEHPVIDADRALRQGEWKWCAQSAGMMREELSGRTIGILGFGHIGRAIAERAKAMGLRVIAANRSPVEPGSLLDDAFPLDERNALYEQSDIVVATLPAVPECIGLVGAEDFAAMKKSALFVNVGRGAVVDEQALFDALTSGEIAAAAIDTWYVYPDNQHPTTQPSRLPFNELDNVLMTPHLSGWTHGTRRRRRAQMAENLRRLVAGQPLANLVRPASDE